MVQICTAQCILLVAYLAVQEVLPQCEEELLELLKVESKVGNGLILRYLPLAREHLGVTERSPEESMIKWQLKSKIQN